MFTDRNNYVHERTVLITNTLIDISLCKTTAFLGTFESLHWFFL